MAEARANRPHVVLAISGLDSGTFHVAEFKGTDAISRPYRFDMTLTAADHTIDPGDLVGKRASLLLFRDGEYYPYSGIVSHFRFVDRSTDRTTYSMRLVPGLWLLSLNRRSRVFQNMSVPDIVKSILDETGLGEFCRFVIHRSHPRQEYVVQYQESDLDFVSRLLECRGIWYFFREPPVSGEEMRGEPGTEELVVSDSPDEFTSISGMSEILFRTRSGMVERVGEEARESLSDLAWSRRILPGNVFVKNYNYRRPETTVTGKAVVEGGGPGTVYEYGGDFLDTDGAQAAADVLRRRLQSALTTVEGAGTCRGLRAGHRFTVAGHARTDFNTTYVVTSVRHTGGHVVETVGAAARGYANRFHAIPGASAQHYAPPRRTPVPRISGIITAPIEARGGDYAGLDDMGRYKVRMPFDISDSPNAEASKAVRLAQPYAGAGYGMHFPSHEGTEMVLACIDGDPSRPLGIGTAPNAATMSPVTGANRQQNILRTAGNNELLMDDADGSQVVRLCTAASNVVEMDDGRRRVVLQTTDENLLLLDDKNQQAAWKAGDHAVTITYKAGSEGIVISTAAGHVVRIDDANERLTVQSAKGHMIDMDDGAKTLTLTDCRGKSTVTLDGRKGLFLESGGEINITAAKGLTIEAAEVSISTSQGALEATAARDMTLSGMNVKVEASAGSVNVEGMNVGLKGALKATMEGTAGVEISSKVQTKVSGTLAEVSSSAITTIKGGLVMIN